MNENGGFRIRCIHLMGYSALLIVMLLIMLLILA